ncbi:tetratricopeptide repeat-containing sensor histidine kinase [uncultured Winogradskyella sp.]|uniref:tetratricopeptide repeat-containing sensor histidine kinase n=1 Tax=uncultured Winogradskyella sp. TaxID=395353 RepID=UPI00260819E7|nr:tetratricopeptide repeat-containing sensor histidine kinase [uncultured Winogradskyella sp.]
MNKYRLHCLGFLFCLIFNCSNNVEKKTNIISNKIVDSINSLLDSSKTKNIANPKSYAQKAFLLSKIHKNDSLWYKSLDRLSIINYRLGLLDTFRMNSEMYYLKALYNKDTLNLAKSHYNLGSYYYKVFTYDSAYYHFNKSQHFFKEIGDSLQVTANLLNMAILHTAVGDYHSSENISIEALSFLESYKKSSYRLSLYNNLGIISNDLEDYDAARFWYNKALSFTKSSKQKITLQNNLGITFRNEKQYELALDLFKQALSNPKIENYANIKAMVIDNIGYVKLLTNEQNPLKELNEAYSIRKQEGSISGQMVSQLHLGEFYWNHNKDFIKANTFYELALFNANKLGNIKYKLKALLKLSKINPNANYLNSYVQLQDSIINYERSLKREFAKIRYRTDQKESENFILEKLNTSQSLIIEKQRNQNLVFVILLVILIGSILILIVYNYQRRKLQSQKLIIEKLRVRHEEKNKLSVYLHDDVASDLLLGLQKGNILQKEFNDPYLKETMNYFDNAYNKMRKISQNLNSEQFKHISFDKKIIFLISEYNFDSSLKIKSIGVSSIDWNSIQHDVKVVIFGIIREAFNNIIKHSQASEATISIKKVKDILQIDIKDNGKGFSNIESLSSGIGISNIRAKVKEMNGLFNISNLPIQGSLLEIKLKI